jgi:hypothetical protein
MNGRLILAIDRSRLDWQMEGVDEGDPWQVPVLDRWSEAVAGFQAVVEAWLRRGDVPDLLRVAFGAVLLQPVASIEEGNQRLMQAVPGLPLKINNTSDALFQVNRPCESWSYAGQLRLNRLTKWSVATIQSFEISLPRMVPVSTGDEQCVFRVELDINTDATRGKPLDRSRLPELFGELVQLALGLATDGDVHEK